MATTKKPVAKSGKNAKPAAKAAPAKKAPAKAVAPKNAKKTPVKAAPAKAAAQAAPKKPVTATKAPAKKAAPTKKAAPAKNVTTKKSTASSVKKTTTNKPAPAKKAAPATKKTAPAAKAAPAKKAAPASKKAAPVAKKGAPAKKEAPAAAKKAAPAPKAAPAKKAAPVAKPAAAPAKGAMAPAKKVAAAPAQPAKKEAPAAAPAPTPRPKKAAPAKKAATIIKTTLAGQRTPTPAARPTVSRTRDEKKPNIIVAHRRLENKSQKADDAGKTMINYQPDYTRSILDQPEEQTGPVYRYSDEELNEFRELITQRLEAARKELVYLQGLITRKDEAGTDDTENRYMNMEDGSGAMEREQLAQLASRQIQFINHLEKAMMRIENKTYGICRVTGKLIDKARLRAVPHATLSIEAKKFMSNNK